MRSKNASGAARTAKYRARQRAGRMCVSVEVTEGDVERLVALAYLRNDDADNPAKVGAAAGRLISDLKLVDVSKA